MAIKLPNGRFKCMFCNFTDGNSATVDSHRDSEHDYVLVPFLREEIVRLHQFIYTKDEKLITEDLYKKIREYSKFKVKKQEDLFNDV